MSFLVTVHERRVAGGQTVWTTLGLGKHTLSERAATVSLVKERLLQRLKAWVKRAGARDIARLEQLPGRELERHRLTLEVGRLALSVSVPLVLEPRHTGAGELLTIGYHPLAQEDFFFVDMNAPRGPQYRAFLEHLRRTASDDEALRELETKKDRLRTLVFDADVPSLLERVGPKKRAWWQDLVPEAQSGQDDEATRGSELEALATDLSERASDGTLPLGLPREPLDTRLGTLLARGSVVLIGAPGVGKTTLVHRYVDRRLWDEGYRQHKSLDQVHRVWSLSGRRILAGMKHHGDWEARMARLMDELRRRRDVLYVPDLAAWSLLGRSRDSDRNLADVMRGALERREVTLVGEATPEAWARLEEDAPAFAAHLQVLRVDAPSDPEVVRMLLAAARVFEGEEDVVFEPSVFAVLREWSAVLHPGRAEPGRSLALLEQARHLDEYVTEYEVVEALSERAGVPVELLAHRARVAGYVPQVLQRLRAHVVGQPEATGALVDVAQRVRLGLTDAARPWGVFLLTGPTGTGKTELAKGLAQHLYGSPSHLLRVDMNQLTGPDAAARLLGDGFGTEGLLTAPILDAPFQVVLLDELDKAHRSVLYLLLQLLDEGRLTDATGRTADFRRTVILITSNLGAGGRPALGFGDGPDAAQRRADLTRAVAQALPPELFNRLDGVLAFQPLSEEAARVIAATQVTRLAERPGLRDRGGTLSWTPAVIDLVVRRGFDPEYGARTVKRWVEAHLADRVAAALVARPGDGMKRVTLGAAGDEVVVDVEALETAPATHRLPFVALLGASPAACEGELDRMITTLAALSPTATADDAAADAEGPARAGPRRVAPASADEADRLYWRERLREALARALKTLRRIRSMRRSPTREIVHALSEASFLARVAAEVDAPIHRATVLLRRPTAARSRRLVSALVATLAAAPWEVEAQAPAGVAAASNGVVQADALVLRIAGLGVRLALAAEVGAHVHDLLADGVEVVTLELLDDDVEPADVLSRLPAAAPLLPEVRTVRHEAHKTEARPYLVVDHRTGHRDAGHIVTLEELLGVCLSLSRSAEPRGEGAP